jgi:hypothetical protein
MNGARRPHANQTHITVSDSVLSLVGGHQPPLSDLDLEYRFNFVLCDWRYPLIHHAYFLRIDIDPNNLVTFLCQTDRIDQSDIAQTKNTNLHDLPF